MEDQMVLLPGVGGTVGGVHPSGLYNIPNASGQRQRLCPVNKHHLRMRRHVVDEVSYPPPPPPQTHTHTLTIAVFPLALLATPSQTMPRFHCQCLAVSKMDHLATPQAGCGEVRWVWTADWSRRLKLRASLAGSPVVMEIQILKALRVS